MVTKTRFPIGTLAQFREDSKKRKTSDLKKLQSFYKKFPPTSSIGRQNLRVIIKELRKRK